MSTGPGQARETALRADAAVRGNDHDTSVVLREASWDDFQALVRRIAIAQGLVPPELDWVRLTPSRDQPP